MFFITVWKNRIRKFFDHPGAIIPFFKKYLYYNFVADNYLKYYKDFKYLSYEETLNTIIDKNISIVRFGDELFDMLHGIGLYYGNWRQKYDPRLAERLREIISSKNPKILVCFNPEFILKSKEEFKKEGIADQYLFWTNSKIFLKDYYHRDTVYGSALCFTPRYNKNISYEKLNSFFLTKDIIIVTSNISRFNGIELGKTTMFIEAPQSDAWQQYERIQHTLLTELEQRNIKKETALVLVSMGSAAKVLVYDLSLLGYTAWDTGQFFDLASTAISKMKQVG